MDELHTKLVALVPVSKDKTQQFLQQFVARLGAVARYKSLPIDDFVRDLDGRLHRKDTDRNSRHPYPQQGVHFVLRADIPDFPGSYELLLEALATKFDTWASTSNTVTLGEVAEITMLLATKHNHVPKDIEEVTSIINNIALQRISEDVIPSGYSAKQRMIFPRIEDAGWFTADSERAFYQQQRKLVRSFWQRLQDKRWIPIQAASRPKQ